MRGQFPPRARLVGLSDIATTGTELRRMHLRLVRSGFDVTRLHALVHRGPRLPISYDGIRYGASVHFPLPLTNRSHCFECLLGRPLMPLLEASVRSGRSSKTTRGSSPVPGPGWSERDSCSFASRPRGDWPVPAFEALNVLINLPLGLA